MKRLIAVTAFTLMCGSAFAQTTGAPAAAHNDMNKPGMNNPDRANQGTTGTSSMPSPRGDASTSGAGPAAGAHNTGSAKEPGAVQKGVNKQ
jgi:hypothetical protein